MKQAVPSAPGPEGRSCFQKVSLVSRRLESAGSARGREGSPSRVSLLLQAWEREIVEKTAAGSTTLMHREHSSSVNLLKDFTAHGPIFSQVYSPAQKPRRQDERGKVGAGGGGGGISLPVGAPQEVPVHRESYVHGTLLPTPPAERPAGGPGEGPGAPCGAKPGCVSALPRARHVTILRTGRDAARPESGLAEGREAQNGMHDAAGTTMALPQRESHEQDGTGFAGAAAGSEGSPGSTEATGLQAEGSPGEKHLPQAEAPPANTALRDGERPEDPPTSITSSLQCPSADTSGEADLAGAGERSEADGGGTISATPPRTESPPGAGSTPQNPSSDTSNGPEPSSKAPASPKAEVELEGGELTGDPQGTAQESESSPEPPTTAPAHDPLADSPPDTTEEDPELLVDMEIFVDTLRNMEPSEMRKAPKAPRQPRPSSLGRCAALPPIHEDRVAPRAPISLPQALRELLARGPVGQQEESPEEEIENPYLSPDERAPVGTLQGGPGDRTTSNGWVEGGSLPGTPRQAGAEEKNKPVAGGLAERSVLFRGNVLKGMALLSHFLEHRAGAADEGKPYSRLDNSMLYSRFVSPSTALLELPSTDDGGVGSPTPRDHNGLGLGDHPGSKVAVLEALNPGCIPPVTEEPEHTVALCPADVLVSESLSAVHGEMLCPPGHAGRWWGLIPQSIFLRSQHMAHASHQRSRGLKAPSAMGGYWDGQWEGTRMSDRRVPGWVMEGIGMGDGRIPGWVMEGTILGDRRVPGWVTEGHQVKRWEGATMDDGRSQGG